MMTAVLIAVASVAGLAVLLGGGLWVMYRFALRHMRAVHAIMAKDEDEARRKASK